MARLRHCFHPSRLGCALFCMRLPGHSGSGNFFSRGDYSSRAAAFSSRVFFIIFFHTRRTSPVTSPHNWVTTADYVSLTLLTFGLHTFMPSSHNKRSNIARWLQGVTREMTANRCVNEKQLNGFGWIKKWSVFNLALDWIWQDWLPFVCRFTNWYSDNEKDIIFLD